MKGQKGSMNIDFSEYYDSECDIYYVTFKTGEPSLVKELDDNLLVEVGIFTNMPTGFRILNFKKSGIKEIECVVEEVSEIFESAKEKFKADSKTRESRVDAFLESAFA